MVNRGTRTTCNVTKDTKKCERISLSKYAVTVIPLTILFALLFFMLFQFIGERLGWLPYIHFDSTPLFTSAEGVILLILSIGISIFLAMIIAFVIFKKRA